MKRISSAVSLGVANEVATPKKLIKMGNINFPYKLPILIIPKPDSKDQRWYIMYKAWDVQQQKLVRVRYFKINEISNLKKRKEEADAEMLRIKLELITGHCIDSVAQENAARQHDEAQKISRLLLISSLKQFLAQKEKLRPKTYKNYIHYINRCIDWLVDTGRKNMMVSRFSKTDAEEYFTWLVVKEGLSPRSHNNHKSYMSTAFNWMIDNGWIKNNPILKIAKMTEGNGMNKAYTFDQKKEIIDFCEKNFMMIIPVINTMYYTFLRTNELSRLQIKHIGMYSSNQIYLPKEISKNGFERHVQIPDPLAAVFHTMRISDFDPEYYLFGFPNMRPSATCYPGNSLAGRYARRVLKPLGLDKQDYTLYSWKHTGVVAAKKAGLTDASIMLQGGWREIKSYQSYLKSLGLEGNDEFLKNMPAL